MHATTSDLRTRGWTIDHVTTRTRMSSAPSSPLTLLEDRQTDEWTMWRDCQEIKRPGDCSHVSEIVLRGSGMPPDIASIK